MMSQQNLLIIYPYFTPAKRAGGIVSSLNNLVDLLNRYTIYIYTSAYDLDGSSLDVEQNRWIQFSSNCQILYATHDFNIDICPFIGERNIQTVYINGVYGLKFFLKPLWQLRYWKIGELNKLIIAPRGMIHAGALAIKPKKKRLYFSFLRLVGFLNNITWHATDNQEVMDVRSFFSTNQVKLAMDSPTQKPHFISSHKGLMAPIRIIFLSLLTEKKNLKFLLTIVARLDLNDFILDIYGPIKDEAYWNDCLSMIATLSNVYYCGEVQPTEVTQKMSEYDYFVLPTLGENFGHVIYESLVAGTPVIISDKTSWCNIDASSVGWVIPLEEDLWLERFKSLPAIKNEEYLGMRSNCHRYIENYLAANNPLEEYDKLIGNG